MHDTPRCEICGAAQGAVDLVEAEIIGAVRTVCTDCHGHVQDAW